MENKFDFLDNPIKYKQILNKAFKNIFSGTIKETFLIEIVNKITNDIRYSAIFMQSYTPEKIFSIESLAVGRKFRETTICKMIVMMHYMNTISLSDSERGKLQGDSGYKTKLCNEVIKMLALERMATSDYSDTSFEAYLPIIFYVSALNSYLANKYDELANTLVETQISKNKAFNLKMLYKFIMRIKACINLADLRATDELMVIYRTVIEMFLTYSALWNENDGVIESFEKFDVAAFNYNYDGIIPDEFKFMANDNNVSEVKFVNYGWIRDLKEFKSLSNKKNAYSLSGLSKIIDKKYDDIIPNLGSDLYKFYKSCNPQTHGTMMLMNYFQLELHIFQNLAAMLRFVCDIILKDFINLDYKIGAIDLFKELDSVINIARKITSWLNESDKNLEKTNLDYRARAICVLKMKELM